VSCGLYYDHHQRGALTAVAFTVSKYMYRPVLGAGWAIGSG